MDFENEINDLKRRVGDLEGAFGVLTGHLNHVHPDLVQLRELTQRSFSSMETAMGRFAERLDTMNTQVWSLRDDLPDLVASAVNSRKY